MRTILQFVGAAALVVWTVSGVAAWLLVKDGVHVTLEEGSGRRSGTDPVALLREDLADLGRETGNLRTDLAKGLEQLAGALSEDAEQRHRELRSSVAELLAAVRVPAAAAPGEVACAARETRIAAVLERIERGLERSAAAPLTAGPLQGKLGSEGAASPAAHAAMPGGAGTQSARVESRAAASGVTNEVAARTPASDPASSQAESRPATPHPESRTAALCPESRAAALRAPESRRSFLSFALPGDGFAFDRLQRFEIIPSLSRVGFDAKSTLHDFTGVTSAVRGFVVARLSAPQKDASARIEADVVALDTGLADRNTAMAEHLASGTHPKIVFELAEFEPSEIDAAGKKVAGVVKGSMTIRGVTRPLAMPVRVSIDESMRLVLDGESSIELPDFGVPVPSKLGLIGMQEQVRIWISLRARFAGGVKP